MSVNALLQTLGFSDYEARAYVRLVGAGTCNGYEVAKAAGMPRANVYAVLERLVERGAARRLDTRAGKRYAAVAPSQLLHRLDARHRRTLAAAETALASLDQEEQAIPVFNLDGYDELIREALATIDAATGSLQLAIQPVEAAALAESLRDARERDVAITTLCMHACDANCGGCQRDVHRYNLSPASDTRWLIIVADRRHTLVGEITAASASAITTGQHLVVELASAYINQSLALAIMADDLGDRFQNLLSQQANKLLDALQPEGGFFERLEEITGGKAD